jgi:dihydroorotase
MRVLIRNATITSTSSPFNGQSKDILIEHGIIKTIGDNIPQDSAQVITHDGMNVSEGWMDCFANFCDPGFEYKETLQTGSMAAASGGFTAVMLVPNTQPVIDNKSQVEYLRQLSNIPVTIFPIGAITQKCEGKELTEMYDMRKSGALAFSDGLNPIQSSGILLKALQYVLSFGGTIIQLPDDRNIGSTGLMNEGIISTRLGLPGKPAISEELLIARDIELAAYSGSKIHFTGISTKRSLDCILEAKAKGVRVSCSVTPYHLFFCDEDLVTYDTNLKVNPPLRTKEDMLAIRMATIEGKIDFMASHHQPQDWDGKTCEFEYARYGMDTLESAFSVAMKCGIDIQTFVKMQTVNISSLFDLPFHPIAQGNPANLTLFDPHAESIITDMHSRSKNNAFINKPLRGKTFGIINGEKLFLN